MGGVPVSSDDFVQLILQLGVMLAAGVGLGLVMRKLRQPAVLGEMLAGIIIGVTVLGAVAPGIHEWIFDSPDAVLAGRDAVIRVGMLLFLYVAGSEVDLADIRSLGRQSFLIGVVGTIIPILAGVALVYATPMSMWGETAGIGRLEFSLFIGINLANSANPVLARILLDLGMMKSKIATVMMTATVVDDLVNWTLYAIILGSISTASGGSDSNLATDLAMVALLFVAVLGGIRWLAPRLIDQARRHLAWPNGYVAVMALVLLAVSGVAEAIGVAAFLGAFLTGVAFSGVASTVGATGHKAVTVTAVSFFAPLYFVSMAMGTDFIEAFDPVLVLTVIAVALASKLLGVLAGVRLAGLPLGREAWAMAWGLNARGATGIILAATGLEAGIIEAEVFVALVVTAIVTSMIAGPAMIKALGKTRTEAGIEEDEALERGPEGPGVVYPARMVDRDMTEAERAESADEVLFRVLVAIDDPTTAAPLVEVAASLAASQHPGEVVLSSFEKQTELEGKVRFHVLDAIASELDSLHGLEAIVEAHGVSVQTYSQRSTDLVADITSHAVQVGAHALVVGDRRDDPDWVAIVDGLIAATPIDIYVVVAPLPRAGLEERREGPPVVEAGSGLSGDASLEAAARFALTGTHGPIVVGIDPEAKSSRRYREVLDRLDRLGRPGRIEPGSLATVDGAAAASTAALVVRPFAAPEGLEPVERARPDAERLGCPVVLVAADPRREQRSSLDDMLDEADERAIAAATD